MSISFLTPVTASDGVTPTPPPYAPEHTLFESLWSGAKVHGIPTMARAGGVFVQPAHVVLGLRGFADAHEGYTGVKHTPFAFFEFEKIIRMLWASSGLALEILGSAMVQYTHTDFDARLLLQKIVTRRVLEHYVDVTAGHFDRIEDVHTHTATPSLQFLIFLRELLTGATLSRDGAFCAHLPTLLEYWAAQEVEVILQDWEQHSKLEMQARLVLMNWLTHWRAYLQNDSLALPCAPCDYQGAHDWLVSARMRAHTPKDASFNTC